MTAEAISLPLVFLAGVVSFASPCFLPIVPVFISYLSGGSEPKKFPQLARASVSGFIGEENRSASSPSAGVRTPRLSASRLGDGKSRTLLNAAAFVGAFSAVFVLLWVLIATVGWAAAGYKDTLRVIGGMVLLVLGLITAGLLRFDWMGRLAPNARMGRDFGAPTLGRSALMGLGFGAGWSPCIGPVLGVVLGLSVNSGSVLTGTFLLVLYCLGLGLPFLLVAAGATWVTERLSWFSRHYQAVQYVSAALLMSMGVLMITNLLAPLSGFSWITV